MNLKKCLRALDFCDGVVRQVTDQEIMDAKARVGAGGLGCEPASAASVAGAKRLREEGVIAPRDRVVCILTGHQLKDPTATVAYHGADQEQFEKVLGSRGRPPRRVRQPPGRRRQRPRRHHPDDRALLGREVGSRRDLTGGAMRRYAIVVEKAATNYAAYLPDLPGCVATGATVEETRAFAEGSDRRFTSRG